MNWTADEIRQLRCRLGWSRAELARQLKIDLSMIFEWEAGELPETHESEIQSRCKKSLAHLFYQAESYATNTLRAPIAEVVMRDRGLSQIHTLEIIESEFPAETKRSVEQG